MWRIQLYQNKDFRVRLPSSKGKYVDFVKIRTLYAINPHYDDAKTDYVLVEKDQ